MISRRPLTAPYIPFGIRRFLYLTYTDWYASAKSQKPEHTSLSFVIAVFISAVLIVRQYPLRRFPAMYAYLKGPRLTQLLDLAS